MRFIRDIRNKRFQNLKFWLNLMQLSRFWRGQSHFYFGFFHHGSIATGIFAFFSVFFARHLASSDSNQLIAEMLKPACHASFNRCARPKHSKVLAPLIFFRENAFVFQFDNTLIKGGLKRLNLLWNAVKLRILLHLRPKVDWNLDDATLSYVCCGISMQSKFQSPGISVFDVLKVNCQSRIYKFRSIKTSQSQVSVLCQFKSLLSQSCLSSSQSCVFLFSQSYH